MRLASGKGRGSPHLGLLTRIRRLFRVTSFALIASSACSAHKNDLGFCCHPQTLHRINKCLERALTGKSPQGCRNVKIEGVRRKCDTRLLTVYH